MKIITGKDLEPSFFSYQEEGDAATVKEILDQVQLKGDQALLDYTEEFDGVRPAALKVPLQTIKESREQADPDFLEACRLAADNIRIFARRQLGQIQDFEIEITPGVKAGQRVIPISRVGVYVPGGSFPLISSLLMGAVPAQVAGAEKIIISSPPSFSGDINPAILAAADLIGIQEIYRLGGVQAIGALAYGTETVPQVDKIVGPGNSYVTQAKKIVLGRVGIDLLAGPTEVMIIADQSGDPELIAADLLAQAEHDPAAIAVLITTSSALAKKVKENVNKQLQDLPTGAIARQSLDRNGAIILVENNEQAIEIANKKAPEHLELQVQNQDYFQEKLLNFGSLFLGQQTCEVFGDYTSGLNHTLPTNTTARYAGGLNVLDFVKLPTTLEITATGLRQIGPAAATLADWEGLAGHARAARRRL